MTGFVANMRPRVGVVIPTWKRPVDLRRCIEGVVKQTLPPVVIMPVARPDDLPTWRVFDDVQATGVLGPIGLLPVRVKRPGFLAPLVAAQEKLASTDVDVVAIFDDDSEPDARFLEIACHHYSDPSVAAVGGRYVSYYRGEMLPIPEARTVGSVDWLGRAFGGMTSPPAVPGARDVSFIIGGAATYRADVFRTVKFPVEMDRDVAYAYEQFVGSQVIRGGRIVYEPSAFVKHYTGDREAIGVRPVESNDPEAVQLARNARQAAAWNAAFALWKLLSGPKRYIAAANFVLIGSSEFPGPIYRLVKPHRKSILNWRQAAAAKVAAFRCAARNSWTALSGDDVR